MASRITVWYAHLWAAHMARTFLAVIVGLIAWHSSVVGAAESELRLPEPLSQDAELVDRYWQWLKTDLQAPLDLPPPHIDVEPLPTNAEMALYFPSAEEPQRELRIVISPRMIQMAQAGERLEVLRALAHEIVHYVMLMAENDWDYERRAFENSIHHHCDPTFQRLTRHVASVIQLSCWEEGHQLGGG